MRHRRRALALLGLAALAAACGGGPAGAPAQAVPLSRTEGQPIAGAEEWRWIPFPDTTCTDAVADSSGRYRFGTSTTGLAVSWGPPGSTDLVVFLQGGGACWEYVTCGGAAPLVPKTASTGPFGPAEFARDVYDRYPRSWLRRANLPVPLRDATVVFVPYCTGDVHAGDRITTYHSVLPGFGPITWHHAGRTNLLAFLRRLVPTFPRPGRLVVAGSSGGGFGVLAGYPVIRDRWPDAEAFFVDDSAPPLEGDAIPPATRAGWYESWDLGAALDPFCPECREDLSAGLREILRRYPRDRVALVSHLQDEVIRGFFGTITVTPRPALTPMPPATFEADLRRLGTDVLDPATPNGRYFFTQGTGHPTLDDPGAIAAPAPGLSRWLELMFSGSPEWRSATE